MGELAFPILCRCFLSGMWPILSCMSMATCSHGRRSESLQNIGDGVKGSILWRQGNLGDLMNCLMASSLVCLVWFCLAVDWLIFYLSSTSG